MTPIEWTNRTWNPLRAIARDPVTKTGWACEKVSPGCANCYAESINRRLGTGLPYTVPAMTEVATFLDEKRLAKPASWRKPAMVFVCSMTDLYGRWVPEADIRAIAFAMRGNPQHTFQVLTKRPERMAELHPRLTATGYMPESHIWRGTSAENQAAADLRIPHLLNVRTAVPWLSLEPLLGPIVLRPEWLAAIRWVVVGGESGSGSRNCDVQWIRAIVHQCREAGVPVFVKQLGKKPMERRELPKFDWPRGTMWRNDLVARLKHPKGGDMAEWPEDLRVRQWPVAS